MVGACAPQGVVPLTSNGDHSCKRHRFPRLRPDPVAHSKRLWQPSAYIALTVFMDRPLCKSPADAVIVVTSSATRRLGAQPTDLVTTADTGQRGGLRQNRRFYAESQPGTVQKSPSRGRSIESVVSHVRVAARLGFVISNAYTASNRGLEGEVSVLVVCTLARQFVWQCGLLGPAQWLRHEWLLLPKQCEVHAALLLPSQ